MGPSRRHHVREMDQLSRTCIGRLAGSLAVATYCTAAAGTTKYTLFVEGELDADATLLLHHHHHTAQPRMSCMHLHRCPVPNTRERRSLSTPYCDFPRAHRPPITRCAFSSRILHIDAPFAIPSGVRCTRMKRHLVGIVSSQGPPGTLGPGSRTARA